MNLTAGGTKTTPLAGRIGPNDSCRGVRDRRSWFYARQARNHAHRLAQSRHLLVRSISFFFAYVHDVFCVPVTSGTRRQTKTANPIRTAVITAYWRFICSARFRSPHIGRKFLFPTKAPYVSIAGCQTFHSKVAPDVGAKDNPINSPTASRENSGYLSAYFGASEAAIFWNRGSFRSRAAVNGGSCPKSFRSGFFALPAVLKL